MERFCGFRFVNRPGLFGAAGIGHLGTRASRDM